VTRRALTAALASLLLVCGLAVEVRTCRADGGAAIIVEVNGVPITGADLDEALLMDDDYLRAKRLGSSAAAAELRRQAEARVLDALVDEILLLGAARAARITLTPEEEKGVATEFDERVKERWGSVEALEEEMKVRRIRIEKLKTRNRNGFIIRKLAYEEMGRGGFVRPEELLRYYEDHKDRWRQDGVAVVSIIRVLKAGRSPEDARAAIDQALAALEKGQSMAEVATGYPDGPKFDEGATIEAKSIQEMRPAWRPALLALKAGERTGVVETKDDFFIAKLERLESDRARAFEEVQDEIYTRLEDEVRRERLDALRERLRKSAFVNPKDPLGAAARSR